MRFLLKSCGELDGWRRVWRWLTWGMSRSSLRMLSKMCLTLTHVRHVSQLVENALKDVFDVDSREACLAARWECSQRWSTSSQRGPSGAGLMLCAASERKQNLASPESVHINNIMPFITAISERPFFTLIIPILGQYQHDTRFLMRSAWIICDISDICFRNLQ